MNSGLGVLVVIVIVCWIVVAIVRGAARASRLSSRDRQQLSAQTTETANSTMYEKPLTPRGSLDRDREIVQISAQSMVRVINESLQIAASTKNEETRRSRLGVARTQLASLDQLAQQFPFLRPTNRDAVEATIEALEAQIDKSENGERATPQGEGVQGVEQTQTARSLQQMADANADIVKGWRFVATLQRRTPLKVLKMHGATVGGHSQPPLECSIADGVWLPLTKTWEELSTNKHWGQQLDSLWLSRGVQSSDVGEVPTDGGEYLQFLIAFRTIFESEDTAESKMNRIQALGSDPAYVRYLKLYAEQSPNWLLDMFASVFSVVPGIGSERAHVLFRAGFRRLEDLDAASDEALDKLEGFGPKIIQNIRQFRVKSKRGPRQFLGG